MRVFLAGGSLHSSRTTAGGRAIAQARPAPQLRRRLGPNGALPTREDGPEYLETHVVEKRDVTPPLRHMRLDERQMISVQLVGHVVEPRRDRAGRLARHERVRTQTA